VIGCVGKFIRKYFFMPVKHMMHFWNVILTVTVTGKSMLIWKSRMGIMKWQKRYDSELL